MAYITCQVLDVKNESDVVRVHLQALVSRKRISGIICEDIDSFLFSGNEGKHWHIISGYLPANRKISDFYSGDEAFLEEGKNLFSFSEKNLPMHNLDEIKKGTYINIEK